MHRCVPFVTPAPSAWCAGVSLALVLATVPVRAQDIDPRFPVTNGPVSAMALAGDTLYVAGRFSWIGPANGSMVALDAATGDPVGPWPRFSYGQYPGTPFDVFASACLADEEGGCWVGGGFASVEGAPTWGLAHVRPDGSLDPACPASRTYRPF